jgi:hypothetical protein
MRNVAARRGEPRFKMISLRTYPEAAMCCWSQALATCMAERMFGEAVKCLGADKQGLFQRRAAVGGLQ